MGKDLKPSEVPVLLHHLAGGAEKYHEGHGRDSKQVLHPHKSPGVTATPAPFVAQSCSTVQGNDKVAV